MDLRCSFVRNWGLALNIITKKASITLHFRKLQGAICQELQAETKYIYSVDIHQNINKHV